MIGGAGSQLGPLRVHERLGEGAFARVHRATLEGKVVALKVFKVAALATPERLARLERERRIFAEVDHPGIVKFVRAGAQGGVPWVALELVPGARSLDEVVAGLPARARVALIRDAARAIGAAHARGVAHGDVKPSNVLVDETGRVRVTDFGLAWAAKSPPSASADVFALGLILAEVLVEAAAAGDPVLGLDAVCRRALRDDPAARQRDGEALAREIEGTLESTTVSGPVPILPIPPPRNAPTLEIGSRLGSYTLLELIGKGGMGEVFRARDGRLDRDVAVKILTSDRRSEHADSRFVREIEAASRVKHPNIVCVHGAGVTEGVRYLVTDLVNGEGLDKLLRRSGALDPPRVAAIGSKIALALDALHRAGVFHRDVKPSNILLDEDGEPRLVDFGIAKITDAIDLTRSHEIVGTPHYSPPEQLAGAPIDGRADIYALGATLYEAVAGVRAFPAETLTSLVYAKTKRVVPPSRLREDHDESLDAVCVRCLEPRAEARFETAAELARALEGARSRQATSRSAFATALVLAGCAVGLVLAALALRKPVADTRIADLERTVAAKREEARSLADLDLAAVASAVFALRADEIESSRAAAGVVAWAGLAALGHGDLETAGRAATILGRDGSPEAAALRGALAVVRGEDARHALIDLESARRAGFKVHELDVWRLRAMLRLGVDRTEDARQALAALARARSRGVELDAADTELEVACYVALGQAKGARKALTRLAHPRAELAWSAALLAVDDALDHGDLRAASSALGSLTPPPGLPDAGCLRRADRALALVERSIVRVGKCEDLDPKESAALAAALELHARLAPGQPLPSSAHESLAHALTILVWDHLTTEVALAAAEALPEDDEVTFYVAVRAIGARGQAECVRLEAIARRATARGSRVHRLQALPFVVRALLGQSRWDDALREGREARERVGHAVADAELAADVAAEIEGELDLASAVACRRSGKPAAALPYLEGAHLDARPGELALERSRCLLAVGRTEDAFATGLDYLRTPTLTGTEREALIELIWSLGVSLRRVAELQPLLDTASARHAGDSFLWLLRRAFVAAEKGDLAGAAAAIRRARATPGAPPLPVGIEDQLEKHDPAALRLLQAAEHENAPVTPAE